MPGLKFCFLLVLLAVFIVTISESCNIGFGNLGFGNVGIGNIGFGNKGVLNKGFGNKGLLNQGFRNIGVLNRKSANTIGVGNFFKIRRIGVGSIITVPNFFPTG